MRADITPLIETVELSFSGRVVSFDLDLSEDAMKESAAVFIACANKLGVQEHLRDKALANGNTAAAEKAKQEIADITEEAFVRVLDKETYDKLLAAITNDHPERRADCMPSFTEVMHALNKVYTEKRTRENELDESIPAEVKEAASEMFATPDPDEEQAAKVARMEAAREEYMAAMRDLEGADVAQPVAVEVVK